MSPEHSKSQAGNALLQALLSIVVVGVIAVKTLTYFGSTLDSKLRYQTACLNEAGVQYVVLEIDPDGTNSSDTIGFRPAQCYSGGTIGSSREGIYYETPDSGAESGGLGVGYNGGY